ncbi:MAG: hypothetical protein OXJ54_00670 [Gemmatimonadetes bacterium]|nr:hypothetical protein [Candidatus Palauibacter rhopaloidicola]
MSAGSAPLRYALALLLSACGGSVGEPRPEPPGVASVEVIPGATLIVGEGGEADFRAVARTGTGTVASGLLRWSVEDPAVATLVSEAAATAVVRGVAPGVTRVIATVDGTRGSATLEVFVPENVTRYEPDRSYFGRKGYVEYVPGELPLILSASHGGGIAPAEIPDRRGGTHVTDTNTRELTLAMRDALVELTGRAPHVIISHLVRPKLDSNREIVEAAEGNPYAEQAWHEFQDWIGTARATVAADFGVGLFLDIHGHGHAIDRLELGYLLRAADLNQPDAALDRAEVISRSSIRALAQASPLPFSRLLRGATSLGGFLEAEDVPSVPSPEDPSPGDAPYFRGGYNTREHGSLATGETVSGIQIEHHYRGVRDTDRNRRDYAARAARALHRYMLEHYGEHYRGIAGSTPP